ncbi:hypothetical protein N3K66_001336 [Trichothecium roseum]|uniref:Uncharacterized protein n=1 Tax=Trichothecium roseum TaxID=47278 RepID=A0ACC0VFY2_9HYPO|nr:hypothetical protein N3K66_001336 [Trichothecium roseum]
MATKGVPLLKFMGTVSLGLLTGVSYTVSTLTLPSLLNLPSSLSASHALAAMTSALRVPVLSLTTLSAGSLLLSFALSPGSARHPYLLYTSVLAVASGVAPALLPAPPKAAAAGAPKQKKPRKLPTRSMEASYEVLGDVPGEEPVSEEDEGVVNGEEVRAEVDGVAKGFLVRTGVSALAFAMAVMGVWGDGAPQTAVYI